MDEFHIIKRYCQSNHSNSSVQHQLRTVIENKKFRVKNCKCSQRKNQKAGAKFTTKKQNSQFHIGLPNNHCVHTRDTLFVAAGCFQSARTRYSWLSFYTLDDHSGSSVVHVTDCMLVGSAYTRRGPKVWPAAFQHLPQQGVSQRIMSPREMACFSPAMRPH